MLQGRLFSYPDTHRHRLGANYQQLPINCPYAGKVTNQQRDGPMTINNQGSDVNYEPNSIKGSAKQQPQVHIKKYYVDDWVARSPYVHPNSDFEQVGTFYRSVLSDRDRDHLVGNMLGSLSLARTDIQARIIDILAKCDKDYAQRIAKGLQEKGSKL